MSRDDNVFIKQMKIENQTGYRLRKQTRNWIKRKLIVFVCAREIIK